MHKQKLFTLALIFLLVSISCSSLIPIVDAAVVLDSNTATASTGELIHAVHWGVISAQGHSWNQDLYTKAKVTSVKVKMYKYGSPTGTLRCRIASHTGVYGTSSTPLADLETSINSQNIASLSSNSARPTTVTFLFAGTAEILKDVPYTFYVYAESGSLDGSNYCVVRSTANVHDGNRFQPTGIEGIWASSTSRDLYFQVYGEEIAGVAYVVDLTKTFTITFTKLHQTDFSVPLIFSPTITFAKLIQSAFNILFDFAPNIAFTLLATCGYFINLVFQPVISFSMIIGSIFNVLLSFTPVISFIILLQSTFGVLLTYTTNIAFDLLASAGYFVNLIFTPTILFVLEIVYTAFEGIAYIVDLIFAPSISFVLDIIHSVLAIHISIFFIGLLTFFTLVFLALLLTRRKND